MTRGPRLCQPGAALQSWVPQTLLVESVKLRSSQFFQISSQNRKEPWKNRMLYPGKIAGIAHPKPHARPRKKRKAGLTGGRGVSRRLRSNAPESRRARARGDTNDRGCPWRRAADAPRSRPSRRSTRAASHAPARVHLSCGGVGLCGRRAVLRIELGQLGQPLGALVVCGAVRNGRGQHGRCGRRSGLAGRRCRGGLLARA